MRPSFRMRSVTLRPTMPAAPVMQICMSVPVEAPLMTGPEPQHGEETEDEEYCDEHAGRRPAAAHRQHDARHQQPAGDHRNDNGGRGDQRTVTALRHAHQSENPPSAEMMMPVVKALSSEARWTATAAISSGSPTRPIGCRSTNILSAFSLLPMSRPRASTRSSQEGERTVPGQMALQRMPLRMKSAATALVRPITAALLAP